MTTTISTAELRSVDPATGAVVGAVPTASRDDIRACVERARSAQLAWAARPIEERAACLRPAGAALAARADDLGRLLMREMGKPLAEAVGEARHCGESMDETIAEIVAALAPQTLHDDNAVSVIHRDPFGVCAVIAPWNFPLAMPHWMIVPALLAGNTAVLKPSEETPLIAQAYVDVLNETLPAGVLQIVHGADDQGRDLVASDVDLIAFTGSREVGKKILGAASDGLKRVILELGGKDPLIILADADIEEAATFAVRNSFRNAGQVCVSTERIYVDERVGAEFEKAMIRLTGEQRVGPGTADGVTIGPMINDCQRRQVVEQIDAAVRDGATIAARLSAPEGNYVDPTVLTNVTHDMEIMREETFGPVACIMRCRDDDEAVTLANDTPFGLGASVFGESAHAEAVARRLTAGMIGINKGCGGATGAPWVGARQSGYGFHSGPEGHRQFTQPRVVSRAK